jgi:hypothetical protein
MWRTGDQIFMKFGIKDNQQSHDDDDDDDNDDNDDRA